MSNRLFVYDKGCDQTYKTAYLKVVLHPKTILISSSPAYMALKGDTVIYRVDSIGRDLQRNITFHTRYKNTDFAIGDTVWHKSMLTASAASNATIYDMDSMKVEMVYSYDPNEKIVQLPGDSVLTDFNLLRYTIHFQNEGNDEARDVVVTDTLDSRIDYNTIQTLYTSHTNVFSLSGNTVTWTFKNINLVPKTLDEEKSKGQIVFEVNKKAAMKIGDSLKNRAFIFFDLNPPVITEYATVRIVEEVKDTVPADTGGTSIGQQPVFGKDLKVYPNPAHHELTVSNISIKPVALIVRDIMGHAVMSVMIEAQSSRKLDISSLSSGIYLLEMPDSWQHHKLIVR